MPKEDPSGRKSHLFEFLEIPNKFKEEDRLFAGNAEFYKSEREKGILSKMIDAIFKRRVKSLDCFLTIKPIF